MVKENIKNEVLYEKEFPSVNFPDVSDEESAELRKKLAELSRKYNSAPLIPIAGKSALQNSFISEAVSISDLMEINLKITKRKDGIEAVFVSESFVDMQSFSALFGLCDDSIIIKSPDKTNRLELNCFLRTHVPQTDL